MSEYGSMGHDELSSRAFNGDAYAAGVMNERQQMEMDQRAARNQVSGPTYYPGSASTSSGPSVVTDLFRFQAFIFWGLIPGALYYFHWLGTTTPGYRAMGISAIGMFLTSGQFRKLVGRVVLVVVLFFLGVQLMLYLGQHPGGR